MKKRVVSVVLTLCMMLTFIPLTLLAASAQDVQYVVAGTSNLFGNAWDYTTESGNLMTQTESGKYELVLSPTEACGSAEFRVAKLIDGLVDSYYSNGLGGNMNINVSGGGDITISFDPSTEEITVSGDNVTVVTVLQISSMSTVGNGSGNWLHGSNWYPDDDANLMTESSSGVYEITYTGVSANNAYQFKFAADSSWSNNWGGSIDSENAVFNGDTITFAVEQDNSTVKLVLDLTNYNHSTKTGATYKVYVNGTQINGSGSASNTQTGSCGANATYTLDKTTGALTISGTGEIYDYSSYENPSPFSSTTDVNTATIGEGITGIGNFLFYQCSNLTTVTLPSTLEEIGEGAFAYSGITSIDVPAKVSIIQKCAFVACDNLKTVTLHEGLKTISDEVFVYSSIENIVIPDSVTKIGDNVFEYCGYLDTVTLGKELETLGNNVFYEAFNLTGITVSEDNENFVVENNVLFNKDKTTLILYVPRNTAVEYIIPSTVKNISQSAFFRAEKIQKIIVPDGVTEIAKGTFAGCNCLQEIKLPATLKKIGEDAFDGCYDLKDIYFTGTIDDVTENLNEVSSGNSYYHEATKHYIETSVVSVTHGEPFFRGFNKFDFKVVGRASKLQVIHPNGATYTVSRHSALSTGTNVKGLVSIKSYDANDNEVSNGSANIKYEIWTINMNLAEGKYTVKAKYGDKWDSIAKKFTVKYETGAEVASVKINGTANGGYNLYSVKINGSASKIQVLLPNGGTYTFDRSEKLVTGSSRGVVSIKAYDKNNKEVALGSADTTSELWVINMLLKEGSYTVKAKYKSIWEATGKAFTVSYPTKATDEVKITTAEGKDGGYSFKVNGTAQKLQIVYANGATSTFSKTNSCIDVKYYNNKKVEVDKYSGEVAYEIWTVSKKLADGSYKAIVKYHNGTTYVWGTKALEFDIELGELTANIDGAKTEVELIEALEAVKQTGGTVTLADDITLSQTLVLSDYGTNESFVTLDLNDFTLTGNVFIDNSSVSIQNGTVNYTLPEDVTSEADLGAIDGYYSNVQLKNLTVDATDVFAVIVSGASVIIEDSTFNGKPGERMLDLLGTTVYEGITVLNTYGALMLKGEITIEHKLGISSDTSTRVYAGSSGTIDGIAFEVTEARYITSADPFVKNLHMA